MDNKYIQWIINIKFIQRFVLSIMTQSLTPNQADLLRQCLLLSQNLDQHGAARDRFAQLRETVTNDASLAVLDALWEEVLAARRSAVFWEQVSDIEKTMSERLADTHFQLQQNYLRLMQEQ